MDRTFGGTCECEYSKWNMFFEEYVSVHVPFWICAQSVSSKMFSPYGTKHLWKQKWICLHYHLYLRRGLKNMYKFIFSYGQNPYTEFFCNLQYFNPLVSWQLISLFVAYSIYITELFRSPYTIENCHMTWLVSILYGDQEVSVLYIKFYVIIDFINP